MFLKSNHVKRKTARTLDIPRFELGPQTESRGRNYEKPRGPKNLKNDRKTKNAKNCKAEKNENDFEPNIHRLLGASVSTQISYHDKAAHE